MNKVQKALKFMKNIYCINTYVNLKIYNFLFNHGMLANVEGMIM